MGKASAEWISHIYPMYWVYSKPSDYSVCHTARAAVLSQRPTCGEKDKSGGNKMQFEPKVTRRSVLKAGAATLAAASFGRFASPAMAQDVEVVDIDDAFVQARPEGHTSEIQSLMRNSSAV